MCGQPRPTLTKANRSPAVRETNYEVGVANAVMFTELLDTTVRTHSQMMRRGSLGPNELRFKVRMYLHLQYATNYRVLHIGAGAMRAFEAAVDTFGAAKVPRFKAKMAGGTPRRTPHATVGLKGVTPVKKSAVTSFTGCWLYMSGRGPHDQ